MSLSLTDFFIIFIFVILAYGLINLLRIGLSQWLKWDIGEKEKLLQQKLTELTYECDKYREEVTDLRKQIKLLLRQYDDAVIRLNQIKEEYKKANESAESLKMELERVRNAMHEPESSGQFNRILIAAVGSQSKALSLDSAGLWAVNTETGLAFEQIEASSEKLMESLDRARARRAVTYLHLAIKSDEKGYQLNDKIVDASWLAPILQGVVILVVTGSDSSTVGELLGVVPYVITMNDKIPSRDAALFSRNFWVEIGRGLGPTQALQRALQVSPARMKTYVISHWG